MDPEKLLEDALEMRKQQEEERRRQEDLDAMDPHDAAVEAYLAGLRTGNSVEDYRLGGWSNPSGLAGSSGPSGYSYPYSGSYTYPSSVPVTPPQPPPTVITELEAINPCEYCGKDATLKFDSKKGWDAKFTHLVCSPECKALLLFKIDLA